MTAPPPRVEWVTGQQPHPHPEWLTAAETARELNVSTSTVYSLCKRGGLPHARVGHMIRVPRARLWDWLTQQQVGR